MRSCSIVSGSISVATEQTNHQHVVVFSAYVVLACSVQCEMLLVSCAAAEPTT